MSAGISCSDGRTFWYEEAVVEDYKKHLRIKVDKIVSEKYHQLMNLFMGMGWKEVDITFWLQDKARKFYESPKSCPDYPSVFMLKYRRQFPNARYLPVEVIKKELDRLRRQALAEAEKKLPAAEKEAEEQLKRNLLVSYCLIFADRKGKIVRQDSNPFWSAGEMKCDDGTLKIRCRIQQSGYGNGSCLVTVSEKSRIVLKACGNFIAGPYDVKF